jgi:(2Fe-2S) ferredoxin
MRRKVTNGAIPLARVCLPSQEAGRYPLLLGARADNLLDALRREINARSLEDEVQVTACESLGLCEHGLNMIVYPDGVWYSGVNPEDAQEIVRSHFEEDTPVERLVRTDAAGLRAEILTNRQKLLRTRAAREATGPFPKK